MGRTKILKGFTVIEVMIGIALFSLIMPSIIAAVISIGDLNDRAADLTRANLVAERKIESVRSAGFNSMPIGSFDFTDELDESFGEPKDATYTVTLPEPGLKKMTLNIDYTDKGATRYLTFESYISELGVTQ